MEAQRGIITRARSSCWTQPAYKSTTVLVPAKHRAFLRARKKERKKKKNAYAIFPHAQWRRLFISRSQRAILKAHSRSWWMRPSKRESGAVGSSGVIVFPSSPLSPCPYPVHVSTRHSAQEVQTIDSFSLSSRLSPCIAYPPRYSARDSFEDRDPSVCAERSRESRL